MRVKSGLGLVVGLVLMVSLLSCLKSSISSIVGTGYIWVATQGNQQVSAFQLDLSDGAITAVGTNQATGAQPSAMVVTPDRQTLFIANTAEKGGTISSYTVNSDGSLSAGQSSVQTMIQGPGMTLGLSPVAMAVDPSGKFLFVADQGQPNNASAPGGVSVFTISGTSLTATGPACPANFPVTTCPFVISDPITGFGTGPSAVLVAPSGNFLYVANALSNTVQSFSYDASGNLQALNTFQTGSNPSALAFSRCAGVTQGTVNCASADGNTLFVANSGSNNLSLFTACIQVSTTCANPDGSLVQLPSSPAAAGISPVAFMVDPTANVVYAVNSKSNNVSQYSYSPANGGLVPLSPPTIATGVSPFGGGVTSDGAFALISNNNGSSMNVYIVGTGGKLALPSTSSITLAGQPSAIVVR